jgi:hypothetical protein
MIGHRIRTRYAALFLSAVVLTLQACGGGDDTTTPTPGITISLSPSSATVPAGGSTTVTATVTGTGGFTGTPGATVTGAPAGVTFAVSNVQTSGATTTISVLVSVASTVAAGTYSLTVTGAASGVTAATATFALTVTAVAASSYALALAPTSLSIAQGANGTATVNLTRTNFTAAVTLAAENLPSGVTAAFNTSPTTGNSSTLTLTASATATAGTSNVTIRGTATGATDQTAVLALTITAPTAGNYSLSATPTSVPVNQGASGTSTINITRTGGFAGSVALAVTGAPTGVTATLNPTSTTGNTATLTIAASATATVGSAPLTITGTATGLANQTTTVTVTVAAVGGGTGNVTLDYSACTGTLATSKPIWVAFQDGTGAWTRVTGTNDVYKFNVTSGKGGFAATTQSGTSFSTVVSLFTQAELISGPIAFCTTQGTRSVTGSVAALGQTDAAFVSMGGGTATVTAASLNFTLNNMLSGPQDLVAYRTNLIAGPSASDRAVITRDLNTASGGSVGTIDFAGGAAITPASGTITVTGGLAGDAYTHIMSYLTGASCSSGTLYVSSGGTSATLAAFGIPAASQRATDFHQVLIATGSATATRSVFATFHTFGNQTIALGVALPTPTITSLAATYKRLQAVVTLPSDYQTSASLTYSAGGKSGSVTTSFGFLGSAAATIAFPDFGGVAGFDATWLPASATTVSTVVAATGSSIAITSPSFNFCTEGLRFKLASISGSN